MKRSWVVRVFFIGCALWVSGGAIAFAQSDGREESIISFTSDMSLRLDGRMVVVETIDYDFGTHERRGIFRIIPLGFRAHGQPTHTAIEVIGVTDENANPYPYTIVSSDPLNIKIGDAATFISGTHTYVITYEVSSIVGFFDTYDEIYWNVTGNVWEVPIQQVQATVHIEAPLSRNDIRSAHYCGVKGQTNECGTISVQENGDVIFQTESGRILDPGEQITVAVGFPKGLIPVPGTWDFIRAAAGKYWPIPFPFLLAFFWFRKRVMYWRKRRIYYKNHPVITQFDPGEYTPLQAAAIVNGAIAFKDITAHLISLAIRGNLTISHTAGQLSFIRKSVRNISTQEKALLDDLHEKNVSEVQGSFRMHVWAIIRQVMKELGSRSYITVRKGEGRDARSAASHRFFPPIIALFLAINPGVFLWILLGREIGIIYSGTFAIIGIVYIFLRPKKTYLLEKGLDAERYLLGLKRYIEVAEKDRIQFANAPAKTPELFEKLLPYAMVFGLEKKWAKEFEDIYTTLPSWYVGSASVFTPLLLIQDMDTVRSSFSKISTTFDRVSSEVSSSSTSWGGSSGSGGGGSSGGGGGGGGGGSW